MKTIVISGGHSNVGKTRLARQLCELLPNTHFVKIGCGIKKESKTNYFYKHGTPYNQIKPFHTECDYLVIESNSILKEMIPELVIYLEGKERKPSAFLAKDKAHLVSGQPITSQEVENLAKVLEIKISLMRKICWLSGARPELLTVVVD